MVCPEWLAYYGFSIARTSCVYKLVDLGADLFVVPVESLCSHKLNDRLADGYFR